MTFDPLNIREPKEPKPATQPTKTDWFSRAMSVAMFALVLFAVGNNQGWWERGDGERDWDEQVEPTPDQKPASLVFVRELKDQPIDQSLLMREVRSMGIEFRDLDDDLPEAEKYLQYGLTKGVQPPLVVLQDKSNQPIAVYNWPTIEQVKGWVK